MTNRLFSRLTIAIAIIILIRVISLQAYPLMDTTEARYGEMARLMIETNNWITPLFNYDVPFWGKPPMQTWVSALSGAAFGVSEFSLRLPHLLSGLLTLVFVGYFAKAKGVSAPLTVLALLTTVGFYIASGAIMTDSLLALAMTISMMGFYLAWEKNSRKFAYLGFVGIGFGLLVKGPIIIVLVGIAITPWIIVNYGLINGIKQLWQRIPLISGFALSIAIAAPWYVLAEQTTPGFLNYFLVGEHFNRFVVSGWEGDLYGSAHDEPRGSIWIFWLYTAFPWSLIAIYLLAKPSKRKEVFKDTENKNWHSFLLFWLISPMILFTFAGNILPMYVLPGIPALALFVVSAQKSFNRFEYALSAIAPVAICLIITFGQAKLNEKSEVLLLSNIDKSATVYYVGKPPFSGRFYTNGQAKIWQKDTIITQAPYYIVADKRSNPASFQAEECSLENTNRKRSLYKCSGI